ncbi:hypothetical protein E9993_17585 [Labilibacter sediminis]|nr:hypothetical protein E9993_17585 [Labilibacter sediminis]
MKNMKNIINSIILVLVVVLQVSCDEKEKYVQINSSTVEASGEYYVRYDQEKLGEDPFGAGFNKIIAFNTSVDNGKEIWIADEGHFWDYKVKIPVNLDNLTFGSADTVINVVEDYEIKVIVNNGKIIHNVVELPSGVKADSIYFELWFEDLQDVGGGAYFDEDDVFTVAGYRKSGFLEDEPH